MDMETQEDGEVKDGEVVKPENSFWHGASGRKFETSQFSYDVKGLALSTWQFEFS